MDIFEFAMNIEKDSQDLYLKMSEKTDIKSLKMIFNLLIDEEKKHYDILKKMKDNININTSKTKILTDSKKVFQSLNKNALDINISKDFYDLLESAKKMETESKTFYLDKAEIIDNKDQKLLLLNLADEEDKHFILLDNIQVFLSRPKLWVENAEFNHLDEY